MASEVHRLRADFRFTIYDRWSGGTRIVLTGAQTGQQFVKDTRSNITILIWFDMLRLYLDSAKAFRATPLKTETDDG